MIMSLVFEERNSFALLADMAISIVSLLSDWYWFARDKWGNFTSVDIMYYGILTGLMFLRSWYSANNPNNPVEISNERRLLVNLDKVHLVWITRSATLVSQVYPDILNLWDELVAAWGHEQAQKVCQISIHVTDMNSFARRALVDEIEDSSLYKEGCIKFGRPDLQNVMEREAEQRIQSGNASNTLLAFCGSHRMAKDVKTAKMLQDISLHTTGNSMNEVDLVIESYGGYRSKDDGNDDHGQIDVDTSNSSGSLQQRSEQLGSERQVRVHPTNGSNFGTSEEDSIPSNDSLTKCTAATNDNSLIDSTTELCGTQCSRSQPGK